MGVYGDQANPYKIAIPGWDDIISIHPSIKSQWEPQAAKDDWKEFYQRRKTGTLDEMADQRLRRYIERKANKYDAIKASPTPEVVKGIAKIMTYIDDTEDLLSTALVLGRSLLKKIPWLLTKLGTKFIPVLGWALTIRDLLEIAAMLWRLLPCGRVGKKKSMDMLSPLNFTRRARLKRASRFMKGKFGVGAALEAAQASDTLFGTGLQLGPIVGMITDSVFGAAKAAGGATVQIQFPGGNPGASDEQRVMNGMDSASRILAGVPDALQETHMLALVALALGLQVLQPTFNNEEMIARSDEIMGFNVPLKRPWEPLTREILMSDGIDPDRDEPHILPGSPTDLSYLEMAKTYQQADSIKYLAKMFPSGIDAGFVTTTVQEYGMWTFNADLPLEQWEANEPTVELTIPERHIIRSYEL